MSLLLLCTLLSLLLSPPAVTASSSGGTYQNAHYGYAISYGQRWRSRDPSSGRAEPYQLLLVDEAGSALVGFYAVRGKATEDLDAFGEMDEYLCDEHARGRIMLLERLREDDYAQRSCASWTLLHLGEGVAWRIVVIPHDPGGRNQIYLVVIAMMLPQHADRLDATVDSLLRGLRFTLPAKSAAWNGSTRVWAAGRRLSGHHPIGRGRQGIYDRGRAPE